MPTYTFSCRRVGAAETVQRECQGPEQAVQYARRYLEQALQDHDPADDAASVTVAEEHPTEESRWLGAWDWTPEDGWVWTALD